MRKELKKFSKWTGVWLGANKLVTGKPGWLRLEIRERLGGEILELLAENVGQDGGDFTGGVALLGVASDGRLQMMSYSSSYGAMILEQAPDDPGVLSLTGSNAQGLHLSVAIVVEEGEMLLTTVVRLRGEENPSVRTATRLRMLKAVSDKGTDPGVKAK